MAYSTTSSRHWTGTRSGFNQRGGTDAEQLRVALRVARQKAEDELRAAAGKLVELIGEDAYQDWIETNVLDTDSLEQITAKILSYSQAITETGSVNNLEAKL